MCNLGECLVEESRNEGRIEGRAEGEAKGKESKLIENIRSLMKNLKQSYEYVAQCLDMSEEEIERYRSRVL